MLSIKVKVDLAPVRRLVNNMEKQVRFAAAQALTQTAKDVAVAEGREMELVFEGPVPYTTRTGIGISPARRDSLEAQVFLKRKQAAYLAAQIEGGARRRRPFEAQASKELDGHVASAVPGSGIKTDARGNISKATIARLTRSATARGGKFYYRKLDGGITVLYERGARGAKPKPMLVFTAKRAQYRRRFDFYGVAQREVDRRFAGNFDRSLQRALATAR